MVAAQTHGGVDVLGGGDAVLDQLNGLVDHGDQQAVADEAGGLGHGDGSLADLLSQGEDGVVGIVGGVAAADDLNQLHGHRGIEEVHADDLVLALNAGSNLGDGDGGGVGGQDALVLGGLVQLLEDALLQVHALDGGLDDQIGVVQNAGVLGGGHEVHAALQTGDLLLGHLATGDHLGEALVQGGLGIGDDGIVDINNGDVLAGGGKHLSNAAAHLAGADHSNFFDRHDKIPPVEI